MVGVKGNKNIKKVLTTKKRLKSTDLTIGYSNLQDNQKHYLIIISKKVLKKANRRNKLRRRIKNILILNQNLFTKYDTALVKVEKSSLLYMTYKDLNNLILDKFAKLA